MKTGRGAEGCTQDPFLNHLHCLGAWLRCVWRWSKWAGAAAGSGGRWSRHAQVISTAMPSSGIYSALSAGHSSAPATSLVSFAFSFPAPSTMRRRLRSDLTLIRLTQANPGNESLSFVGAVGLFCGCQRVKLGPALEGLLLTARGVRSLFGIASVQICCVLGTGARPQVAFTCSRECFEE